MIESVILTVVQLNTFTGGQLLTNATGFFFMRDGRLYVVTSRHVLLDEASGHKPDRVELELHTDCDNLASVGTLSILLYAEGVGIWKQAQDSAGIVDVVAIEIDRDALPLGTFYCSFTPGHLPGENDLIEAGATVQIPGYPLGFHDHLHHTAVIRQAGIASSFGLRFQGQGVFLTDGRTHRGMSGAPVVMRYPRIPGSKDPLPYKLLGIHSSRLDITTRDFSVDEALGLNCAWYSDVLLPLTEV